MKLKVSTVQLFFLNLRIACVDLLYPASIPVASLMKAWAKRDHRLRHGFRSLQDCLFGLGASVKLASYAFALCEVDVAASWCTLEVNNGADDSSCTIVSLENVEELKGNTYGAGSITHTGLKLPEVVLDPTYKITPRDTRVTSQELLHVHSSFGTLGTTQALPTDSPRCSKAEFAANPHASR
jgi:hypothetical protein